MTHEHARSRRAVCFRPSWGVPSAPSRDTSRAIGAAGAHPSSAALPRGVSSGVARTTEGATAGASTGGRARTVRGRASGAFGAAIVSRTSTGGHWRSGAGSGREGGNTTASAGSTAASAPTTAGSSSRAGSSAAPIAREVSREGAEGTAREGRFHPTRRERACSGVMGCAVVARSSANPTQRARGHLTRVRRAHSGSQPARGCGRHGVRCVRAGSLPLRPSAEFRDASTRPRARAAWGARRDTIRGCACWRHGVRGAARVHGET